MKWFRFYHEFVDDPKIAMMSDSDQLLWVKALCLASDSKVRGLILLSDEEICWKLRVTIETWKHAIDKFRAKGMLDHHPDGYKVTHWDERQFESDSSAERVKRYRLRKKEEESDDTESVLKRECNVTETPPDTDAEQKHNQNKSEKEKNTPAPKGEPSVLVNDSGEIGQSNQNSVDSVKLHGENNKPTDTATKSARASQNKTNSSRSKKKPSASDLEQARLLYLEYKPHAWSGCDVINAERQKLFSRLYQDAVSLDADWREMLVQALKGARSLDWWNSTSLQFETLFRKQNYQMLIEKYKAANPTFTGETTTPNHPDAIAFTEYRDLAKRLGHEVEYRGISEGSICFSLDGDRKWNTFDPKVAQIQVRAWQITSRGQAS